MTHKKPKILCVIPARLGSTRLPEKPLILLDHRTMVQCTYEAAKSCPDFDHVIVATDSEKIKKIIDSLGGECLLTPESLQTGSDRVAYIAKKFDIFDVIVNLQGDEPFVTADMLSTLVEPYLQGAMPHMTTLACPLKEEEINNPNFVKVVYNKKNEALYFSRAPIPFYRQVVKNAPVKLHLGLYAYTRNFLLEYTQLEQTLLEKSELLEQLRVLENGYPIVVCHTEKRVLEINTAEELALAKEILAGKKLF